MQTYFTDDDDLHARAVRYALRPELKPAIERTRK